MEALEDRIVLSFTAPVDYGVGTQASLGQNGFGPQVIAADLNGDGKLDLAETNTADGTVGILLGNGDGTFQAAQTFSTGLGAGNPVWLASADFNGDGKPDLAIMGGNDVSILLGKGDGTFSSPTAYVAGSEVRGGLAVGDFFGNGRQDVAVAAFGVNAVEILPNNGDGTFGAPVTLAMPSSFQAIRSVATGDFFGDGHADLVVAGGTGSNNANSTTNPAGVALFRNDGKGHFTDVGESLAVTTPDPGGGTGQGDNVNPEHVDVADLNGDGLPDLVLSLYDHNVDVFLNAGNGTFKPAVGYTTETLGSVGGYPRGVAFADVNHDGKLDIITDNFGEPTPADQSTPEPGSIGVLLGNGDGTFRAPLQYTPFTYPSGLAVGDFNGDGLPDLAVTQDYTGHQLGVLLDQPNTAQEAPTVSAIAPSSGPTAGGTTVTITGTNFGGTTRVDFGTVAAKFTVVSGTTITATAPAEAAGAVDVSVYDAGASPPTSADRFTYLAPVVNPPTVTGLGPAVGPTGGGTSVTITGTNFTGATAVDFGGVAATSVKVVSPTSILAIAPAEAAGRVDVTVVTPGGTSTAIPVDLFTYQVPVLASIAVLPSTANVPDGGTAPFAATALDQFGKPLATQPAFTWTTAGPGTVGTSGLYSAPATGSGTASVVATVGTLSGSALLAFSPIAAETWTGLGSTSNWSDPANWSGNVVPSPSTAVTFGSTSTKNSVVDPAFGGTIGSVLIGSVYPGTVALARPLNVTGQFVEGNGVFNANGNFAAIGGLAILYGGTFQGSTNETLFLGGLSLTGGTFAGSTGAVAASSVAISSGTLDAPSSTLFISGGNFTSTGGTFNSDGGLVEYVGTNASPTLSLSSSPLRFYDFTDALTDTYPAGMTITGTLSVAHTFAWKAGASFINGNIEAHGDVDDEDHGGIGNPYITLDGGTNQTIEDLSGGGGGQFRTITINKPSGSVALACNPIVFSGLSLVAGSIAPGPDAWLVAGSMSASPGLNLGNVVIDGANVTVGGANLQVTNLAFATPSDRLTAPTGYLGVSGYWYDAAGGSFNPDGGTVIFDGAGAAQAVTGGIPFFNFTVYVGASVILESDVTVLGTFANFGAFNPNGHKLLK